MTDLPPGYVHAVVCSICHERPSACGCPEGFHSPGGIAPHPRRVHCCLCEAVTHEFVRWNVGDSYSFGPLCLECRQSKTAAAVDRGFGGWQCTGLDSPHVLEWIRGEAP